MQFSELLTREHESIRRAIHVLENMTRATEQGVSIDRHDMHALLIFLHYFVDICHHAKEEKILFPILKHASKVTEVDSLRDQLEELLQEHDEEQSLIEEAQVVLFSSDPSRFTAKSRILAAILAEHGLKEEKVLFPMAENLLGESEADEVLMRFEEADANFGHSQITLLMELLQELEGKYLQKAA